MYQMKRGIKRWTNTWKLSFSSVPYSHSAQGNKKNAAWHISWASGSLWNLMSSRIISKDALFKSAYFILQTSNNFKLYFCQCVNPTITFLDSNCNRVTLKLMSKTVWFVYMCKFLWKIDDDIMRESFHMMNISSYFSCHSKKVKHLFWVTVSVYM